MNKSTINKAASYYTISEFLLRAISIITAPIFTRLLTTSEYGLVSNFSAWVSIMALFTGLGLTTSVVKGYTKYSNEINKFVSSVLFLGTIASLIALSLAILFLNQLSDIMNLESSLVVFLFVYLVLFQSVNFAKTQFRFEYKYRSSIFIAVVNSFASIFLSFVLVFSFNESKYIGRILGIFLPLALIGLIFFIKIIYKGRVLFNKEYWNYALKISLPMIPHGLSMLVLSQIDRLMITEFVGNSANGIYSFAYTYGILISIITNSINQAIQPEIYANLQKEKTIEVDSIVNKVIIIISFLAIIVIGLAPEALKILGPIEYFDSRLIVFPIIIGTFCEFIYQNFAIIEIYTEKTKYMPIGSISAALINFILNLIFIPRYGYVIAAYTTLVGYLFLMIFHFFAAKKALGKNIYSTKKIMVQLLMVTILGITLQLMFNFILIRYVFLTIIVLIFYFRFKNDLKNFLISFLDIGAIK
jgi:O-antigen/teichoic acid export membrane protein